jgi:hypothetical protein
LRCSDATATATIRSVIDLSSLPADVRTLIEAHAATIAREDAELLAQRDTIAAMRLQLERLRRMQFGGSVGEGLYDRSRARFASGGFAS